MKDERQVADQVLDLLQAVEGQALPILGIQAVDVADAAGEEVDARVGDGLALLRVGQLALGGDAVLDAADAADLGLDRDALGMGDLDDLGGLLEVDLEGLLMGAVVHDRREASVDALQAVLIGAMVEVKGDRHGDVLVLDEVLDDVGDDLERNLPLGSSARALDDNGRLSGLGGVEDRRGPLEVVGVECGDGVMALRCGVQHVFCAYEHDAPPWLTNNCAKC